MSERLPTSSPFFLDTANGARFCIFHPPAPGLALRGGLVYLHPFAEEMNCSRRIAAVQARRLAALGFGVLQIDLGGCGDSAGEFSDASWDLWRGDGAAAVAWLREHCSDRISLWGLRLGGLLALDLASHLTAPAEHLLLWQPVLNGRKFLTQFLRVALAGQARGGAAGFKDTDAMRAALAAGQMLEIGGYELRPAMASVLEGLDATLMPAPAARVGWLEVAAGAASMPAAVQQLMDQWRGQGARVDVQMVDGAPFWSIPGHAAALPLMRAGELLLAESA